MKPIKEIERPILVDSELRLRPAKLPDDISLAADWYCDPEVMRYSEGDEEARYDSTMIGKMYQYLMGKGELYIIEVSQDGQWLPMGDVTLANDTIPIVIGLAEYRSRGYGKRALKLLIDRARSLGWRQLKVLRIFTFNLRSRRLFESLGFKQAGKEFSEEGLPCWSFALQL